QLLLRLPQGAELRRLSGLHPAAGEAHLSRLAVQGGGPDLVEQMEPLRPLHQGAQDRIAVPGAQKARDMAAIGPAQGVQGAHSSIPRACWRLEISTTGSLGANSPS